MARTLKTFTIASGFFEMAVAAPSMKAALEAWQMKHNAFHQGIAKETHDAAIIEATRAKPGVVLRRAVGSKGQFSVTPKLPKVPKRIGPPRKLKPNRQAIRRAETAIQKAGAEFEKRLSKLEKQRHDLDGLITEETNKWQKRRSELEKALKLASNPKLLR